jgi:hypothetical protein
MKVRWNTTLAELARAQLLQPVRGSLFVIIYTHSSQAFDAFVSKLPNGLNGKPKQVAQARRKKWEMSSGDWEFVDKLVKALEVSRENSFASITHDVLGPSSRYTVLLLAFMNKLKEGKNHCVDQKIIQTQIFTAMEVKKIVRIKDTAAAN